MDLECYPGHPAISLAGNGEFEVLVVAWSLCHYAGWKC